MKCRCTVGCANRNVRTACVLCVDRLSAITWISRPFGWLVDGAEEVDKRGASVPRHGLAAHLTGLRVERGQQREGPVTKVGLEVRVVRLHVALEAMRLQTGAPPRFAHEVVMDVQQAPELARTPVRTTVGRRLARLLQNPRFHLRRQHGRRLTAILRLQAVESLGEKPSTPPIDIVAIANGTWPRCSNTTRRQPASESHAHDARPPHGS